MNVPPEEFIPFDYNAWLLLGKPDIYYIDESRSHKPYPWSWLKEINEYGPTPGNDISWSDWANIGYHFYLKNPAHGH